MIQFDQYGKYIPKHIQAVLWPQIQNDGKVCMVVPEEYTNRKGFKNKKYAMGLKVPVKIVNTCEINHS